MFEVVPDAQGYLIPVEKTLLRVKKRTTDDLERELAKDPVLVDITHGQIQDDLVEQIEKHGELYTENYEHSLFNEADYKSVAVETNRIEFQETGLQTDVTELCGESKGIKRSRKRAISGKPLVSQKTTFKGEDFPEVSLSEDPHVLRDQIKKHQNIKTEIVSLKRVTFTQKLSNLTKCENLPHRQILESLSESIDQGFALMLKHPLDSKDAESSDE